ncbi:hypothetical protein [Succinimonas sp.]|uniref:hypothetical protein n=1 Tax=Succinimonas sp. TaxID=1936151 RepID=UPI00386D4BD2
MKVFCYLLPVFLCSGCSGLGIGSEEYGCRGLPPGSQCRSAREVYEHQGLVSETPLPEGAAPLYREAPAGTGHVTAAEYFGDRLYRYPGDTVITVVNGYTDSEGLVHSGSAVLESLDNGYWYRMRDQGDSLSGDSEAPAATLPPEITRIPFREFLPEKR